MSLRFWLYLAVGIIIVGLVSYWKVERDSLFAQAKSAQQLNEQEKVTSMEEFLARQTDAQKMVGLAKRMNPEDTKLIKLVILRAYELEPNRRDIAVLASAYDPEIKKRIQFLDPLYGAE